LLIAKSVRELDCFSIWAGPPFTNSKPTSKLERIPCTSTKFSEDGSKLLVTKPNCVVSIYDCKFLAEIKSLASALLPCGTYLQTFLKLTSPQEKNVIIWDVGNGQCISFAEEHVKDYLVISSIYELFS
jgi:translation initiation factor 2A